MPHGDELIVRFAYASRVVEGTADSALLAIVQRSWQFNLLNKVHGVLELSNGRLSQVIEAPRRIMVGLVPRILSDGRHTSIDITALEPVAERGFETWFVKGFEGLGYVTPQELPADDAPDNVVFTDAFQRNTPTRKPRPHGPRITKPGTDT